jgi:hypothetical protein
MTCGLRNTGIPGPRNRGGGQTLRYRLEIERGDRWLVREIAG